MSIVSLLIVLILIGVVLYLVNTLIPLDPKIKLLINVIAILAVLLWLAQVFGLLDGNLGRIRVH